MAVFGRLSEWRITRTGILFIVGILVLGGLVTGGIFLVKNHGEVVRHDQAVKVAEQNLKDQSRTATQTTDPAGSSSATGAPSTDTNTSGATTNPATTTPGASDSSQLPVTGLSAAQLAGRAAILATLALSVAYYIASRRATDRL